MLSVPRLRNMLRLFLTRWSHGEPLDIDHRTHVKPRIFNLMVVLGCQLIVHSIVFSSGNDSSIKIEKKKIYRFVYLRRTVENNAFQLFEYSMSRNLSHNALQIQFNQATTVLPNVFIVEIPDRQEICLMFVTHIGVYRWIIKHPTITNAGQLVKLFFFLENLWNLSFEKCQQDPSQSILADITDDYLNTRDYFYRYDLQLYHQVTCAYTDTYLIYALYNEMETIVLRFDNQNHLSKF